MLITFVILRKDGNNRENKEKSREKDKGRKGKKSLMNKELKKGNGKIKKDF